MKKYQSVIVSGVILSAINVLPLFFQNIKYPVIISNILIWLVVSFFVNNTVILTNRYLNSLVVTFLIYLPNLVYVLQNGLVSFVWTICWLLLSAFLAGYFSKLTQ
ncbi:hypothetical protein ACTRSF_01270 [Streptococcus pneumoniae]|uniref:hypothetical protein n=1 Tax=Streptococcus pneumoniae TaxID=1313 RepID=UPI0009DAE3B0|nr:hypothetical protein [Streptococcus pneumoniae]MDG9576101.1 hypothetical protein [Streptococcus pneumoniae]